MYSSLTHINFIILCYIDLLQNYITYMYINMKVSDEHKELINIQNVGKYIVVM
jgi:hypothetical protein